MNSDITDPPTAHGEPVFSAIVKRHATDFRVNEVLDLEFSGSGEHLFLQIEKTAMNTDEVSSLLQACYSVASADIGLCGLKDRHSVSSQWFSVRTSGESVVFEQAAQKFNETQQAEWAASGGYVKSLELVQHARHSRKLKRGAHRCNGFVITLHGIQAREGLEGSLKADTDARLTTIKAQGFPAYIGAQRFGLGAQNLQRARQWFARPRKRCSRQQRSLWLSSARSAVFNVVCAARVRDGSWQQLLEGEPAVLDGTRSFFDSGPGADGEDRSGVVLDSTLQNRLRDFDIHPSAPWWGRGRSPASGACAEFEAIQLQPMAALCEGLERAGLAQERRALRARAESLEYKWVTDDALELTFALSPGVFATTLLRELSIVSEPERENTLSKIRQKQEQERD